MSCLNARCFPSVLMSTVGSGWKTPALDWSHHMIWPCASFREWHHCHVNCSTESAAGPAACCMRLSLLAFCMTPWCGRLNTLKNCVQSPYVQVCFTLGGNFEGPCDAMRPWCGSQPAVAACAGTDAWCVLLCVAAQRFYRSCEKWADILH